MENTGLIEIHIKGKKGAIEVNPENYDINDIINDLHNIEDMLFPGDKNNRPTIGFRQEAGSLVQYYRTKLQVVIGLTAILQHILKNNSIDDLEIKTAKAFDIIQDTAIKRDFIFEIKTSQPDSPILLIDNETNFHRTEDLWVESEFYFYGKITNAGGKDKANIHLVVQENKTHIIQTPQNVLENLENNILYKTYGIRATGKQNLSTGEIDNLKFLELIDYEAKYEKDYLKKLREKAQSWIKGIEPDNWLNEIRGEIN